MKKVCLIGPESTGKSTIAENLAKKYDTVYIPEYAKAIINHQNGQFYEHNVNQVASTKYHFLSSFFSCLGIIVFIMCFF